MDSSVTFPAIFILCYAHSMTHSEKRFIIMQINRYSHVKIMHMVSLISHHLKEKNTAEHGVS
jgi:hypothetical protein